MVNVMVMVMVMVMVRLSVLGTRVKWCGPRGRHGREPQHSKNFSESR